MFLNDIMIVAALNVALASLVCGGFSWLAGFACRSLPQRHGIDAFGLGTCLALPILAGISLVFGWGLLPDLFGNRVTKETNLVQSDEQKTFWLSDNALPGERRLGNASSDQMQFPLDLDRPVDSPVQPLQTSLEQPVAISMDLPPMHAALPNSSPSVEIRSSQSIQTIPNEHSILDWFTVQRCGIILVLIWLFGSLLVMRIRVRDWLQLKRLLSLCHAADAPDVGQSVIQVADRLGLRSSYPVLLSNRILAPVVAGVVKPAIILPADFREQFSECQLRSILAHELAHLRRKDHWMLGVQAAVAILYWWNPLLRMVSNRLSRTRELICDDVAVQCEGNPREYARTIVQLAENASRSHCPSMTWGIGLESGFCELESRISRIVSSTNLQSDTALTGRKMNQLFVTFGLMGIGILFAQFPLAIQDLPRGNSNEVVSIDLPVENRSVIDFGNRQLSKPTGHFHPKVDLHADHQGQPSDLPETDEPDEPDATAGNNKTYSPASLKESESPEDKVTYSGTVLDVNGQPAPRAKVHFSVPDWPLATKLSAETDEFGKFSVTTNAVQYFFSLIVWDAAGRQMAIQNFFKGETIVVKLSEVQSNVVEVVDRRGKPIANARVQFGCGDNFKVDSGLTDATGRWTFQSPKSNKSLNLSAWKDGEGLDYRWFDIGRDRENDLTAVAPILSSDQPERLMLTGAAPLTVTVVDEDNRPIEGISIFPGLLQKKESDNHLNLSAHELVSKTDSNGKVTFPWFPDWQSSKVPVMPISTEHETLNRIYRDNYFPLKDQGHLTIRLRRTVAIRGRVLDRDKNPVPNIEICLQGSLFFHSRPAKTRKDGTFELRASRGHECIVVVDDPNFSAAPNRVNVVSPDEPIENCDFQVASTTRVFGKLINSENGKEVAACSLSLVQSFQHKDSDERNLFRNDWPAMPHISRMGSYTDEQGRFEFRLGPGNYSVRASNDEPFREFVVRGTEKEIELNLQTKTRAMTELRGTAVAEKDPQIQLKGRAISEVEGKPISSARVLVISDGGGWDRWETTTDADGNFQLPMRETSGLIQVFNAGATLANIRQIQSTDREVVLALQPTGRIKGQLIDRNQNPVANERISYGGDEYGTSKRFGGFVMTDKDGNFEISGVAPNWDYVLKIPKNTGEMEYLERLTSVRIEPGKVHDLGTIKTPSSWERLGPAVDFPAEFNRLEFREPQRLERR